MNDFDSSLTTALRDEADRATGTLDTMAAAERLEAGLNRVDRDRHRRTLWTVLATTAAAVVVVAVALLAGQTPHTSTEPIGPPSPSPDAPGATTKLVLHLHSWGGANAQCPPSQAHTVGCRAPVDLAVYADGTVLWGHQDMKGYAQIRLTSRGIRWLEARIKSTGLFERDLALGIRGTAGNLEVDRGGRAVTLGWAQKPNDLSGVSTQAGFAQATPTQAKELRRLEKLLRNPVAWPVPPNMFEQRNPSPFIPTHLWVSWDHSKPDPSKLPSPAREVLTSNLRAVLDGSCGVITTAQAREIATAMQQADLTQDANVSDGIAFDMPGQGNAQSYFHAHPSLPNESTCK